jgi:hypothetical protein
MSEETLGETATRLDKFLVPYGREIILENIEYENGMRVLRLRIREGNRFTVMDLDTGSAGHLGAALSDWASNAAS